jgi:hypothetical protein
MFGFIKKIFGSADVNKDSRVEVAEVAVVIETVKTEAKEAAVEVKAEVKKAAPKTKQAVKQVANKAKPKPNTRKPKPKSKA